MSDGMQGPAMEDGPMAMALLALAGFVGVLILCGLIAWDAGMVGGLLQHGSWPKSTPGDMWSVVGGIWGNLGHPANAWPERARSGVAGPFLFYPILLVQLAALGYGLTWAARGVLRFRRRRERRVFRLGFASVGEINKMLSAKAVVGKTGSVRPSYKGRRGVKPQDVGYRIGKDIRSRRDIYCSVEDVMLILAPPRQGKDVHFCIPYTIDAPGPVVMTSTRGDAFAATVGVREKVGKIFVFDPNHMTDWPARLRWSPIAGSEDPLKALARAAALVTGAGVGEGVQNASYWTGVSTAIMRCYLHAAAVGGKSMADVVRWSTQPSNPEPINLLRVAESEGRAASGWAGELEQGASAEPETRGNMWAGVRRALDCFADPGVLDACSPQIEDLFDVKDFLRGRNTLYVLGKEKKNGSVAPLVTAMMEDIFDQAREIAQRMPNNRLDPPLTVELNEAAHIAPMPNLPAYMGDSGGCSIALHIYLQSMGQARAKWGQDEATIMWDTAAVRVVMGGMGSVNDLEEVSRLIGEFQEKQKTRSRNKFGNYEGAQISKQARRVLSVEELRTLKFGTAVIVARASRPVEVTLEPWWKRKDVGAIKAGQAKVMARLEATAKPVPQVVLDPLGAPAGFVPGNAGFTQGPGYEYNGYGADGMPATAPPPGAAPTGAPALPVGSVPEGYAAAPGMPGQAGQPGIPMAPHEVPAYGSEFLGGAGAPTPEAARLQAHHAAHLQTQTAMAGAGAGAGVPGPQMPFPPGASINGFQPNGGTGAGVPGGAMANGVRGSATVPGVTPPPPGAYPPAATAPPSTYGSPVTPPPGSMPGGPVPGGPVPPGGVMPAGGPMPPGAMPTGAMPPNGVVPGQAGPGQTGPGQPQSGQPGVPPQPAAPTPPAEPGMQTAPGWGGSGMDFPEFQ